MAILNRAGEQWVWEKEVDLWLIVVWNVNKITFYANKHCSNWKRSKSGNDLRRRSLRSRPDCIQIYRHNRQGRMNNLIRFKISDQAMMIKLRNTIVGEKVCVKHVIEREVNDESMLYSWKKWTPWLNGARKSKRYFLYRTTIVIKENS